MTTTLYAQPYDISATGFYFRSAEEYARKAGALRNASGSPVEEFEIQFIDGDLIDAELARAIGLNQGMLARFFDCVDEWSEHEKQVVIIAVGECGYRFEADSRPDDFEVDIYRVDSMRELAEQFVDEGLFGEVPESLHFYIDHDAIARDLALDYGTVEIGGERLIYRCG